MKSTVKNIFPRLCCGGYGEGIWLCDCALRGDKTSVLITPNAEMLGQASSLTSLCELISEGDILFPDGVGIYLAMKRVGFAPSKRVCGIELCEKLLENLSKRGKNPRIFLLGGKFGVAEAAARRLKQNYNGIEICGTSQGYFNADGVQNDVLIQKITDSRAEIVLVCMGFPRQERWMIDNRQRLPSVRLMMGLGGSLDIWSGEISRAPSAIKKTGLEWAYRAFKSPSRIKRLPSVVKFAAETLTAKKQTTPHPRKG